ncbi:hypothetical protein U1Q18_016214 [Sarracenia purpurea var. burkii]
MPLLVPSPWSSLDLQWNVLAFAASWIDVDMDVVESGLRLKWLVCIDAERTWLKPSSQDGFYAEMGIKAREAAMELDNTRRLKDLAWACVCWKCRSPSVLERRRTSPKALEMQKFVWIEILSSIGDMSCSRKNIVYLCALDARTLRFLSILFSVSLARD